MLRDVFEAMKTPETAAAPDGSSTTFSLYVMRPVLNPQAIVNWLSDLGVPDDVRDDPMDFHITIAYSRDELDWSRIRPEHNTLILPQQAWRTTTFGTANVLLAADAQALHTRWRAFRDAGASYDFDEYNPHITVAKGYPSWNDIEPFTTDVPIVLGPECFNLVHDDHG